MAIMTSTIRRAEAPVLPWQTLRWFTIDWAVTLVVLGIYFLLRGVAPASINEAVALTTGLIHAEKALGIFVEPAIQDTSLRWHWLKELANFTYAYLHFPVLGVVGIWLWFRGREHFLLMRRVMFISMVIGLVFYYLFPAAPPRLMAMHGYDLGFTDTVFGGDTAVKYAQPSLILNEYAAIPSFHFGWIALASIAIWANTRSRVLRALALGLTLLMTWAIVASANHLFIDMFLGGVVIGISWLIAVRLPVWFPSNREQELVPVSK